MLAPPSVSRISAERLKSHTCDKNDYRYLVILWIPANRDEQPVTYTGTYTDLDDVLSKQWVDRLEVRNREV